ncbi:MAG: PAS domain-containing sensor histidine kinase [Actinomycetes bacterium]
MRVLVAVLALIVAAQYAVIAVAVVPRLARLAEQSNRLITIAKWGAAAFFVGCGLTHVGIAVHILTEPPLHGDAHLTFEHVIPHLAQVIGGLTFIVLASRSLDLRLAPKDVANRLRELETGFRSFVQHSPAAIYIKDREGRFVLGNGYLAQQYATTTEELLGKTDADFVSEETAAEERTADTEVLTTGEVVEREETRPTLDGGVRAYHAVRFPILDAAGEVSGVGGISSDVTERRRAAELQAADQAKNEFLSNVSHELRTPLTAIIGFGQLLELEDLEEGHREAVEHILRGGRHLLELINGVLDLARMESGDINLSLEPLDLPGLVRDLTELLGPMASENGLTVRLPHEGVRGAYVMADRKRLGQVVLNLLSNAIKYNRPGGSITVTWEDAGDDRVALHVTDTGRGIPRARWEEVFAPFDRLGAEATDVQGTGIGLAISRKLTDAMGGQLTFRSTEGEGSTFTVVLPVGIPTQRQAPTDGGREATRPSAGRA